MKSMKLMVVIFLLFACFGEIHAEKYQQNRVMSLVTMFAQGCDKYYFLTKEIVRYFIIACCVVDIDKIDKIAIACDKCDYKLSCRDIWPWLILKHNEKLVHTMQRLVRAGNPDRLARFLLYAQQQEHIRCPACLKDDGWRIVGQEIVDVST